MWGQGNASLYAAWVDESLNIVLRTLAQRAHPLTFDYRVQQGFLMCAVLGLNPFLGPVEEGDPDPNA